MDTFFKILKKSLIATVFIVFIIGVTYVPIPHTNNVPEANAGGPAVALEPTQLINKVQLLFNTTIQVIQKNIAAADLIISELIEWKEFIGDGLAWVAVKQVIANMLDDLIDWAKSGFKGSPVFVQDIDQFLLETADWAESQYIDRLGSAGSFLCEPFKLDIQIALHEEYLHVRENNEPAECTMDDIAANLEDFVDGAPDSFVNSGGWDHWFAVTSNPTMYTAYGSALAAKESLNTNLVIQQSEEWSLMNFGDGFLSSETCTQVTTIDGTKEICEVNTPGKIIQEALSFNLDSGRQSLIQADELNEVIASIITNIANNVFESANGLLDF